MRTNRALALFGASMAALALAACGSEQFPTTQAPVTAPRAAAPVSTPRARLLAAAQQVSSERSARVSIEGSLSGLAASGDITISGSGAIDFAHQRMSLTMEAEIGGQHQRVEIRLVDGTAYENSGDGWQSLSVASAGPAEVPDVQSYIDYLKGVSSDVRVEGRDVVRGEPTTRYAATVDLAKFATSVKSDPSLGDALDMFGGVKIPFTVWVDDAGRIRKLTMTFDLATFFRRLGGSADSAPKMEMTLELYDFGTTVDVQAPAGATSLAEPVDREAQSDLRNALTTEKVIYTDDEAYTAELSKLREIEPSLDWGAKLHTVVSPSATAVCLSVVSASGTTFALYDSSTAGITAYGRTPCPATIGDAAPAGFGTSW